jgi:hypothetical protein
MCDNYLPNYLRQNYNNSHNFSLCFFAQNARSQPPAQYHWLIMNCQQTPNSFMPMQLRIILWPTLYKRVVTFIRLKSWLHTVLKCTLYNSANGCVETYTVKQTRADCITFITYLVFSFADFSSFVNTKTVTVFLTSSRTTWTKESWVLQRNNQWWK